MAIPKNTYSAKQGVSGYSNAGCVQGYRPDGLTNEFVFVNARPIWEE